MTVKKYPEIMAVCKSEASQTLIFKEFQQKIFTSKSRVFYLVSAMKCMCQSGTEDSCRIRAAFLIFPDCYLSSLYLY